MSVNENLRPLTINVIDGCKTGNDVQSTARDAAVVLSLALQHGTPIEAIRHAVTRSGSGEAASILGAIVDRLPTPSEIPSKNGGNV